MISAEQKLPFSGLRFAVYLCAGDDLADIRQTRADSFSVDVPQSAFDIVFCVQLRINLIIRTAKLGQFLDLRLFCIS